MFSNDDSFMIQLQNEQKINIANKVVLNNNTVETCIKSVRECLGVLNDDKDLEREYLDKMNKLNSEMVHEFACKKRKRSQGDGLFFSYTGKCNKKYDKRKGL